MEALAPIPTSATPATAPWTVERYWQETREGEHFVILEGEKIVSPSPTSFHQAISLNFSVALHTWAQRTQLGKWRPAPFDVILSNVDVVQPDLVFVRRENLSRLKDKHLQGPPDIVIEILSPGSIRLDRVRKRVLYAKYGVPEYWIVSPEERTVEILRLQTDGQYAVIDVLESEDALESPLLPGFACPVQDLFVE